MKGMVSSIGDWIERLSAVDTDLQATLQQIATLDREIAQKQGELKILEVDPSAVTIGESYRVQLQKLDDRLNRWRQTLRDLKTHRETIEHDATDARLDKQMGDQLSSSKDADPRRRDAFAGGANPKHAQPARSVGRTLHHDSRLRLPQCKCCSRRYRVSSKRKSHNPMVFIVTPRARLLLVTQPIYRNQRSCQRPCAVCKRICTKFANNWRDSKPRLPQKHFRQQSIQLKRCEDELLQSVEKLIDERADLLRRIAADHHMSIEQLTLAFGQWCQCHDHPHLRDWLLSEESGCATRTDGVDPIARQRLIDEIEALQQTRRDASVRADELPATDP